MSLQTRLAQPAPLVDANAGILAPMEPDRAKARRRGAGSAIALVFFSREGESNRVGVRAVAGSPGKRPAKSCAEKSRARENFARPLHPSLGRRPVRI